MEYLDLVDESGKLIGSKKLRNEVHRDGDWHKAVNIWIINSKGEVLIQKRAATKESYPNFWDVSCAGHVDAGETPLQTTIREAQEELGLIVDPAKLKYLFSVNEEHFLNEGTFIDREIREIYLLKLDQPAEDFTLQKEEVAEVKWISLNQLEEMAKNNAPDLVPHEKEYAKIFDVLRQQLEKA